MLNTVMRLFLAPIVIWMHSQFSMAQMTEGKLNTQQLREWYVGRSVDGHTEKGETLRAYHGPDGKISAIAAGQFKTTGTYTIVDPGHVCIVWKDPAWGNKPCYYVVRDGELWKITRVDDEKLYSRVKPIEGNPFGL